MVSGDRQVVIGERGPFWSMQRHFSTFFDRVDVLVPGPGAEVVTRPLLSRRVQRRSRYTHPTFNSDPGFEERYRVFVKIPPVLTQYFP